MDEWMIKEINANQEKLDTAAIARRRGKGSLPLVHKLSECNDKPVK